MSPPSYERTMRGFTPLPETPGAVSTWATQPMTGTFPHVEGMERNNSGIIIQFRLRSHVLQFPDQQPGQLRLAGVDGTVAESVSD